MNARVKRPSKLKGAVSVKNSNGRLQLVFSHSVSNSSGQLKTKRFYFSVGQPDTPLGRHRAASLATQIQRDIDYGEFDVSLMRYKQAIAAHDDTPLPQPEEERQLDLRDLWEKYEQFKKPQLSQTTFAVDYRRYRNHIATLPSRKLEDAIAIRDYLTKNCTPRTAKRVLTHISACCGWAAKSKLIKENPFLGLIGDIHVPKSKSEEMDINPFSKSERDAVIQAFRESRRYSYYAPLVEFLFFTGCRPSEAIALQWKHITEKFILFEQAITISESGYALKSGLKTQPQRRFPINDQMYSILSAIAPAKPCTSAFVFKSKTGRIIDFGDFLNHAWKGYKNRHGKRIDGIITRLVKQGVVSEYRKPYQCRHTFITLCLEADIDAKDIAKWVGNSPRVIYEHYAGGNKDLQVPTL